MIIKIKKHFCLNKEDKEKGVIFSVPVSLEYIIGGGKFASPKLRCRGYFVLLNKCNTIQIRPVRTAIPVVTPSRVGKSDVNVDISFCFACVCVCVQIKLKLVLVVCPKNLFSSFLTFCTKYSFCWFEIAHRVKTIFTLT